MRPQALRPQLKRDPLGRTAHGTHHMHATRQWIQFGALLTLGAPAISRMAQSASPLLSYVIVGPHRVAFAPDTIREAGRRFVLAPATLQSVTLLLGPAAASDSGDAGESNRWVCYRLAGTPAMSLVLESGEMGGGKWLTGFTFVPAGSRPDLERECARSALAATSVQTDHGLRLGLTRNQVNARLGAVGRDSAGVVLYERSVQVGKEEAPESYTKGSGFTVTLGAGRVVAFSGWRVDSN